MLKPAKQDEVKIKSFACRKDGMKMENTFYGSVMNRDLAYFGQIKISFIFSQTFFQKHTKSITSFVTRMMASFGFVLHMVLLSIIHEATLFRPFRYPLRYCLKPFQ